MEGLANPNVLIYRVLQDQINHHFRLTEYLHVQKATVKSLGMPFFTQLGFTRPLVSVPLSRVIQEITEHFLSERQGFQRKAVLFSGFGVEKQMLLTWEIPIMVKKKKASKAFLSLYRAFSKSVINNSTLLPLCFKIISSCFMP